MLEMGLTMKYIRNSIEFIIDEEQIHYKSYCQMLCMGSLGSDPGFFNTIDKCYSFNQFI